MISDTSNQIKSNQILFVWHLSYLKSNTKCLTEAKNNNDKTYQPSHAHKYPERHGDKQTHTHAHTYKHTSSDPLHLSDRDTVGHPDLRQGKSHRPGSVATETAPTRADKRPHTKVQSPPATRARAVHRTAPPLVDQKQLPVW